MSTKYGHKNMSVKNVSAKCGNHLRGSSSYRNAPKPPSPILLFGCPLKRISLKN